MEHTRGRPLEDALKARDGARLGTVAKRGVKGEILGQEKKETYRGT